MINISEEKIYNYFRYVFCNKDNFRSHFTRISELDNEQKPTQNSVMAGSSI